MTSKKTLLVGAVFTSILGVLCHFLYEWTGNNPIIGLFCATNESTWEHLKLLFFPFMYWVIFNYFQADNNDPNYFTNAAISCFLGLVAIVCSFYTYKGVLGYSIDWINILTYFIGVFVAFYTLYRLEQSDKINIKNIYGIGFFVIMSLLFFIFTYKTPDLGMFISPV